MALFHNFVHNSGMPACDRQALWLSYTRISEFANYAQKNDIHYASCQMVDLAVQLEIGSLGLVNVQYVFCEVGF